MPVAAHSVLAGARVIEFRPLDFLSSVMTGQPVEQCMRVASLVQSYLTAPVSFEPMFSATSMGGSRPKTSDGSLRLRVGYKHVTVQVTAHRLDGPRQLLTRRFCPITPLQCLFDGLSVVHPQHRQLGCRLPFTRSLEHGFGHRRGSAEENGGDTSDEEGDQ